jgi:hypothetical protein
MSAAQVEIQEQPFEELSEAPLESVEDALMELNIRYAAHEITRGRMLERRDQLLTRAKELRRRKYTSYLDRFLPPVTFYSIEEVAKEC